jgi:hypothetical protein
VWGVPVEVIIIHGHTIVYCITTGILGEYLTAAGCVQLALRGVAAFACYLWITQVMSDSVLGQQ